MAGAADVPGAAERARAERAAQGLPPKASDRGLVARLLRAQARPDKGKKAS
jgi:hypothetical protein